MKFEPMTVRAVAEVVGGDVEGDADARVDCLESLEDAGAGDLTFAVDARRAARLTACRAGAAIVPGPIEGAAMPLIRVRNVQEAVARFLAYLAPPEDLPPAGVHPTATVASDAVVAADAAVGPGVVIGPRARIGPRAVLYPCVTVGQDAEIGEDAVLFEGVVVRARCRIGCRARIGPNSVIGHDGFGYYTDRGVHHRIPHVGDVVIEDDVDLGACTCVDRAKFGTTRIAAGTKIDNLVQVAHNVRIGRGCLLAGQAGIAGSAMLGDHVVVGGNAGIRDGVALGDGVQCSAFAAVAEDVPAGQVVVGVPAREAREALRIIQAETRLPDLLKRVRKLEAEREHREPSENH